MTALPIVETEAQNMSAYIPTNLISITDGQIYLRLRCLNSGVLPAVDVGNQFRVSVAKRKLAAYRAVAGDLKLAYAQFEELETFARFGARLDDNTRQDYRTRSAHPRLSETAGVRARVTWRKKLQCYWLCVHDCLMTVPLARMTEAEAGRGK